MGTLYKIADHNRYGPKLLEQKRIAQKLTAAENRVAFLVFLKKIISHYISGHITYELDIVQGLVRLCLPYFDVLTEKGKRSFVDEVVSLLPSSPSNFSRWYPDPEKAKNVLQLAVSRILLKEDYVSLLSGEKLDKAQKVLREKWKVARRNRQIRQLLDNLKLNFNLLLEIKCFTIAEGIARFFKSQAINDADRMLEACWTAAKKYAEKHHDPLEARLFMLKLSNARSFSLR